MGVYKLFLNQISKTSSIEDIFIKANKMLSKKGFQTWISILPGMVPHGDKNETI